MHEGGFGLCLLFFWEGDGHFLTILVGIRLKCRFFDAEQASISVVMGSDSKVKMNVLPIRELVSAIGKVELRQASIRSEVVDVMTPPVPMSVFINHFHNGLAFVTPNGKNLLPSSGFHLRHILFRSNLLPSCSILGQEKFLLTRPHRFDVGVDFGDELVDGFGGGGGGGSGGGFGLRLGFWGEGDDCQQGG